MSQDYRDLIHQIGKDKFNSRFEELQKQIRAQSDKVKAQQKQEYLIILLLGQACVLLNFPDNTVQLLYLPFYFSNTFNIFSFASSKLIIFSSTSYPFSLS